MNTPLSRLKHVMRQKLVWRKFGKICGKQYSRDFYKKSGFKNPVSIGISKMKYSFWCNCEKDLLLDLLAIYFSNNKFID